MRTQTDDLRSELRRVDKQIEFMIRFRPKSIELISLQGKRDMIASTINNMR